MGKIVRLKEDSNSWKASGIKRKDARHRKDHAEIEKPKAKRKDTKRWCLGKEGREHSLKWEICDRYFSYSVWNETCQKCRKRFGYWSPNAWAWERYGEMPESLKQQLEKEEHNGGS